MASGTYRTSSSSSSHDVWGQRISESHENRCLKAENQFSWRCEGPSQSLRWHLGQDKTGRSFWKVRTCCLYHCAAWRWNPRVISSSTRSSIWVLAEFWCFHGTTQSLCFASQFRVSLRGQETIDHWFCRNVRIFRSCQVFEAAWIEVFSGSSCWKQEPISKSYVWYQHGHGGWGLHESQWKF